MVIEKRCWDDLPEECWELIIARLNHHHHSNLEPISLVCKRFLSISNRLRTIFNITLPTILIHQSISRLLQRFPQLKQINIADPLPVNLDEIIREIAQSDLNLEHLNLSKQKRIPGESIKELGERIKLKTLICSHLEILEDTDLNPIAGSFPNLEELDISYPRQTVQHASVSRITDRGMERLVKGLPRIRKLNLSGNQFISDQSLISISSNCRLLNEIYIHGCVFVSHIGINSIMRNCSNLVSLSTNVYSPASTPLFIPKGLHVLDLSEMDISDELLMSVALANVPLNKLVLSDCRGLTFEGLASLLCQYHFLKYLDVKGAVFLTNKHVEILSKYLHHLTFINLDFCNKLTSSSFFSLCNNCPSLEEISMQRTSLGVRDLAISVRKTTKTQRLRLSGNKNLTDETLVDLVSICPHLKLLDISKCWGITGQGIEVVGRSCRELIELNISGCAEVGNLGKEVVFSKLEILRANGPGIDAMALSTIGECFSELTCLHLDHCFGILDEGLKEVVKKCKRLKEVSLKHSEVESIQTLACMVFTRPSLRKIVPPLDIVPNAELRDLYLRHGCMICID